MKEYSEYEKYLMNECFPSYAFEMLMEFAKDRVRLHFPAYGEYIRFLYYWEVHDCNLNYWRIDEYNKGTS